MGPLVSADLRFISPQLDTSQSWKRSDTGQANCVVCPLTSQ